MSRQITQCPLCDAPLRVTEVSCMACNASLRGTFGSAPLARLSAEHQRFVETFVLCRGIIRDVERELGVSYPTVRARLDAAVAALEAIVEAEPDSSRPSEASPAQGDERKRLLAAVGAGRLSPAEAATALRKL